MRQLVYKNSFKKEYALMQKRGKDLTKLSALITLLCQDTPLPEKNRDHALVGNWSGFRDCHIEPDWLLIYKKSKDAHGVETLYLEATGSHADLF
jgi:mRNA interferase YafQ